jgi:hypothetical protein
VAEKAETAKGWLFPVGDEVHELGYQHMFSDMLDALDEGRAPMETFHDGYVVNAIIDACYRSAASKRWEPIALERWHADATRARRKVDGPTRSAPARRKAIVIKEERLPDGSTKSIVKDPKTGRISQRVTKR